MIRSVQGEEIRADYLRQAGLVLRTVESSLQDSLPSCLVPVMPSADIARKPEDWWRRQACPYLENGVQYYYAVEALGKDECSVIKLSKNQALIADYYRVTLYRLPEDDRGVKILLQSTMVKAVDDNTSCHDMLHEVRPGRQMLRQI